MTLDPKIDRTVVCLAPHTTGRPQSAEELLDKLILQLWVSGHGDAVVRWHRCPSETLRDTWVEKYIMKWRSKKFYETSIIGPKRKTAKRDKVHVFEFEFSSDSIQKWAAQNEGPKPDSKSKESTRFCLSTCRTVNFGSPALAPSLPFPPSLPFV
jgi:hypothetical protein